MAKDPAGKSVARKQRGTNVRLLRRRFASALFHELQLLWPVVSALLLIMVGLGIVIGLIEGWSLQESVYFSFVTGLTIGFGDFVPKHLLTRALTIVIGGCGILLTALVAAIAVSALTRAREEPHDS
jgi:Na+-translocating ferredoxin:NAD+ oxidoreductase RnfE subunit